MKVTPLDIRRKEFKRSLRGYADEEVDVFLDDVADEFERLFQENIELQDRIQRMEEQIAGHTQLKNALEKTLVSAQLQADQIIANARKEGELALKDAELKARHIVNDSYSETQRVQQSLIQLKHLEEDFRFKFRSLLEGHLKLLGDVPIASPAEAAVSQPPHVEAAPSGAVVAPVETVEVEAPLAAAIAPVESEPAPVAEVAPVPTEPSPVAEAAPVEPEPAPVAIAEPLEDLVASAEVAEEAEPATPDDDLAELPGSPPAVEQPPLIAEPITAAAFADDVPEYSLSLVKDDSGLDVVEDPSLESAADYLLTEEDVTGEFPGVSAEPEDALPGEFAGLASAADRESTLELEITAEDESLDAEELDEGLEEPTEEQAADGPHGFFFGKHMEADDDGFFSREVPVKDKSRDFEW